MKTRLRTISRRAVFHGVHTFSHVPLESPEEQIRLLRVRGHSGDTNVRCEVRPFYRNRLPRYTALSYTWGSEEDKDEIRLKDMSATGRSLSFVVTGNLFQVLTRIQLEAAVDMSHARWSGWWWIDSICIDQTGKDNGRSEKSIQINMMRKVYQCAHEVYAWLGPGDTYTDLALEFIGSFEQMHSTAVRDGSLTEADDLVDDMDDRQLRHGLTVLFRKTYWSRLWILQELAASRRTTFACGEKTVSWNRIINFATAVSTYLNTWGSRPSSAYARTCTTITHRQYVGLITLIHKDKGMDLVGLIFLSQETTYQNPTDYIRALLGLVTVGDGRNINGRHYHTACALMNRAIEAMMTNMKYGPYAETMSLARRAECKGLATRAHHSSHNFKKNKKLVEQMFLQSQRCDEWRDLLQTCRRIANTMLQYDSVLHSRRIRGGREKWNYTRTYMEREQREGS